MSRNNENENNRYSDEKTFFKNISNLKTYKLNDSKYLSDEKKANLSNYEYITNIISNINYIIDCCTSDILYVKKESILLEIRDILGIETPLRYLKFDNTVTNITEQDYINIKKDCILDILGEDKKVNTMEKTLKLLILEQIYFKKIIPIKSSYGEIFKRLKEDIDKIYNILIKLKDFDIKKRNECFEITKNKYFSDRKKIKYYDSNYTYIITDYNENSNNNKKFNIGFKENNLNTLKNFFEKKETINKYIYSGEHEILVNEYKKNVEEKIPQIKKIYKNVINQYISSVRNNSTIDAIYNKLKKIHLNFTNTYIFEYIFNRPIFNNPINLSENDSQMNFLITLTNKILVLMKYGNETKESGIFWSKTKKEGLIIGNDTKPVEVHIPDYKKNLLGYLFYSYGYLLDRWLSPKDYSNGKYLFTILTKNNLNRNNKFFYKTAEEKIKNSVKNHNKINNKNTYITNFEKKHKLVAKNQ